jgi:hypothetical protein
MDGAKCRHSTPDWLISRGTDWRFLAEVKRGLATTPRAAFSCPVHKGESQWT